MDLDWTTTVIDGVTLVHVRLRNDTTTDRRIRLVNRLDGPVLPPRKHGVPEAGWDDDGYETAITADEQVAVGYACPAPPADPPVELVADERLPSDAVPAERDHSSPAAALRRFGPAAPPRDAVPPPVGFDDLSSRLTSSDEADTEDEIETADETDTATGGDAAAATDAVAVADTGDVSGAHAVTTGPDVSDAAIPDPVHDWLSTVERRVDRAATLTDPSVSDATAVLTEAGGLDAITALPDDVAADAEQLRAVAAVAEALAARAESTDVSLAALRRLA